MLSAWNCCQTLILWARGVIELSAPNASGVITRSIQLCTLVRQTNEFEHKRLLRQLTCLIINSGGNNYNGGVLLAGLN